MLSSRDRLLQHCTVKLVPADSRDWGTGFLVTPNRILTCAHVVAGYEVIPVWWRGQAWTTATVEQILPLPVDLALLQIEPAEGEQPPSVLLSETFSPFDRLYVYGYPDDFPDGGSVTIQCEGAVQEQGGTLIKAQAGQVRPGHSGSPALNWETGRVCGVVSDTRSRSTDLGGLLIPVSTVFSHFPDLQTQNQAAHPQDSLWLTLPLQSPAVSQPRSAVPPPQFSTYNPATFAGRDAETANLTARFQGHCRIVALVGMTGIGKTALGERVVATLMGSLLPSASLRQQEMGQQHESLPYCRFNLDNLSLTPDVASSGAALLRELGEEPTLADQQDPANLVEHILARLRSHPCRLQIDSLERLLRGNEQEGWSEFCDPLWLDLLQKFLAGTDCPSQLLLTSQDIPGDLDTVASRYPQFWHCEPLQGLNTDEQRTLFQNLGLNPTDADWDILQRIGAFYDGHPLVLQVIIEEIRQPPFSGNIARYWQHYEAEFTAVPATTAHKLDRSRLFRRRVRQRVEQSIQRLPEAARQMLCASAVFRRPVPIDFWYAMLPDGDPQAAFDTLQDRHLVEYVSSPNDPLLIRQHNLIRSVAYALLKTAAPIWETAERQAAHLWLTEYQTTPDTPNMENVRGYLEAFNHYFEIEDWKAADQIAWARLNTPTKESLCFQLGTWGYFREQATLHSKQLEIARKTGDRQEEGNASGNLGGAYLSLGQYERAIDLYQQRLMIAREIGDRQGEGNALCGLGLAYESLGQYERAIDLYQQCLAIVREISDRQGEGNALGNLGLAYESLGQYERAIDLYQQCLAIMREISNRQGEGNALCNLGNTYKSLGQYERAIDLYQQCLAIVREIGDRQGEGNALCGLGLAYESLGQYERAIDLYQQCLAIMREIGDRQGEGNALGNLGNTYKSLGQYERAINFHQQALIISQEIGDRRGGGQDLGNLGNAYFSLGQYEQAIDFHQQALIISREIGDRAGEGRVLGNLGNPYYSLGQYEQAIDLYQQHLAIARETGDRRGEGIALGNLGTAYDSLGQYEQVIDLYQQDLTITREIGDRQGEGITLGNLGAVYNSLGQYERAIDLSQQCLTIAREIGYRQGEGAALVSMGGTQFKLGQHSESLTNNQRALDIFREIGVREGEAEALKNLAELHHALGEVKVARDYCQQALALATDLGIPLKAECETLLSDLGKSNDF